MKWHDWRKICNENGLSKEETSESWSNYKDMVAYSEEAALLGISSDEFLVAFAHRDDNRETETVSNQIDELADLSKSINDSIDDDNKEDEQLFVVLENTHADLMVHLENINAKAEYYSHKADMMWQESNGLIFEMSNELRKYKK